MLLKADSFHAHLHLFVKPRKILGLKSASLYKSSQESHYRFATPLYKPFCSTNEVRLYAVRS